MRGMRFMTPACIALALVALGGPDAGQAQSRAIADLLQHAGRVECKFTQVARGDWADDAAKVVAEPADLTAVFYDIDVESGTAEAEGRFGASFIVVRYAQGYLHFMQTLSSGANVTYGARVSM